MGHNIKLQPSGVKEEDSKDLSPEGVTEALFLSTVTGTVLFKHQDICTAYFEAAQKGFFFSLLPLILVTSGNVCNPFSPAVLETRSMCFYHKRLLPFLYSRETDLDKYSSSYFCKPIRTEPVSELSSLLYSAKKIKQTSSPVSSMLYCLSF